MKAFLIYGIMLFSCLVTAQDSKKMLLWGGVAHIGNGDVIPNSAIGIENENISFVADASIIRIDTSSFEVIYVDGLHVYPGIIALNTQVGIKEIDAIKQSHDYQEVGYFNSNVRAATSINMDNLIIPTLKANGILFAQSCPSGGRVSGKSTLVKLDGWNWEDAVLIKETGIHINWPQKYHYWHWHWTSGRGKENKKLAEETERLFDYFEKAKAYNKEAEPNRINLKYEAMKPLFDKTLKLYIHANHVDELLASLKFIEHFNLNAVIVGAHESWLIKDQIRNSEVPLVIDRVHRLPSWSEEPIDLPYSLPKILSEEGILFAIAAENSWEQRNLPFHAGTAAAYGLGKEEALEAISLSPAKILGIDETLGSLEEGKSASLIVSEGDILDPISNKIRYAMINGKFIELKNFQEELSNKYLKKYGIE